MGTTIKGVSMRSSMTEFCWRPRSGDRVERLLDSGVLPSNPYPTYTFRAPVLLDYQVKGLRQREHLRSLPGHVLDVISLSQTKPETINPN